MKHRQPKPARGFSWARLPEYPTEGDVTWRLFRRDHRGKLHMSSLTFTAGTDRRAIASALRRARHQLRDRVDEVDLLAMGVAA